MHLPAAAHRGIIRTSEPKWVFPGIFQNLQDFTASRRSWPIRPSPAAAFLNIGYAEAALTRNSWKVASLKSWQRSMFPGLGLDDNSINKAA
jgi:hypothetical protein